MRLAKASFDQGHDKTFCLALPEVGDLLCCGQRASIFEQLKLHMPLTPAHHTKIIEATYFLCASIPTVPHKHSISLTEWVWFN